MPLECVPLGIAGVKLIRPRLFRDARGFFQQIYHAEEYRAAGIITPFVQDNWSRSAKGVLRGLHYQLRRPQAKLIWVISGAVFDVAVDLRRGSPTFGRWTAAELTEDNHCQMFIPPGFAHGFCVLSDEADVFYKCSDLYTPGDEYCIHWADPDIAVEWPGADFAVSEKDRRAPRIKDLPEDRLPLYS